MQRAETLLSWPRPAWHVAVSPLHVVRLTPDGDLTRPRFLGPSGEMKRPIERRLRFPQLRLLFLNDEHRSVIESMLRSRKVKRSGTTGLAGGAGRTSKTVTGPILSASPNKPGS